MFPQNPPSPRFCLHGSTFWAPVVNLARDGRWGRNIESPGEDPYLSGEYGAAFVDGMEHDPSDPGHILASSCCKVMRVAALCAHLICIAPALLAIASS